MYVYVVGRSTKDPNSPRLSESFQLQWITTYIATFIKLPSFEQ